MSVPACGVRSKPAYCRCLGRSRGAAIYCAPTRGVQMLQVGVQYLQARSYSSPRVTLFIESFRDRDSTSTHRS